MEYFSINTPTLKASFKQAVIQGIAPDKGLYYPEHIPELSKSFFESIGAMSAIEIGIQVMHPYTEGILSKNELKKVFSETIYCSSSLIEPHIFNNCSLVAILFLYVSFTSSNEL